jgi:hypothetical protein
VRRQRFPQAIDWALDGRRALGGHVSEPQTDPRIARALTDAAGRFLGPEAGELIGTALGALDEDDAAHVLPSTMVEHIEREQELRERHGRRSGAASVLGFFVAGAVLGLVAWQSLRSGNLGGLFWAGVSLAVFVAFLRLSVYAGDPRPVLQRLRASLAGPGDLRVARSALEDVRIAFGIGTSPLLYVIESPAVNAIAVGRSLDRSALVVTRGLAEAFAIDEQRAALACLIGRLQLAGEPDVPGATGPICEADARAVHLLKDPRAVISILEKAEGYDLDFTRQNPGAVNWSISLQTIQLNPPPQHLLFETVLSGGRDNPIGDSAGKAYLGMRLRRLRSLLGAEGAPTAARADMPPAPPLGRPRQGNVSAARPGC